MVELCDLLCLFLGGGSVYCIVENVKNSVLGNFEGYGSVFVDDICEMFGYIGMFVDGFVFMFGCKVIFFVSDGVLCYLLVVVGKMFFDWLVGGVW